MATPFLTAEWKTLLMLNYEVDPALLEPLLPRGTEPDEWQGRHFVSLVAFLFRDTKVKGFAIPFHRNFEEINLRFYVRRRVEGELRRGVVFVKEIVPRLAIALVARGLYNENYVALPTRHSLIAANSRIGNSSADNFGTDIRYEWKLSGKWQSLSAKISGTAQPLAPNSHQEFIAEHYWGYTKQRNGGTLEYQVAHPRWKVWNPSEFAADLDVAELYGEKFVSCLSKAPFNALVAEGSPIAVFAGAAM